LTLAPEHYSRPDVQKEISDFCKGRWLALHCLNRLGELVFRRYVRRKPIAVTDPESFSGLTKLRDCSLRSVYATSNVYQRMASVEDAYDLSNIRYCTPTWDVDGVLDNWQETISMAKEILSFLNDCGLNKSVYVEWSGNGCHIHIHEEAFSHELLKRRHPLDLAYATVQYVSSKLSEKFRELSPQGKTIVENKMDLTRVFTCPLSLHRKLDVVCVCMKPNQITDFSPEWISPTSFRHDPSWRESIRGEADGLAESAYEAVGGYPVGPRLRKRRNLPLDKQIMKWLQKEYTELKREFEPLQALNNLGVKRPTRALNLLIERLRLYHLCLGTLSPGPVGEDLSHGPFFRPSCR